MHSTQTLQRPLGASAFALALAIIGTSAPSAISAHGTTPAPVLVADAVDALAAVARVRAATAKYQDIGVALADGYINVDNHCVDAAGEGLPAELGGMGLHYIRPDLLRITATEPRVDGTGTYADWSQPAILLYEPQSDGTMKLVGAENLVFQKAWEEAGNTAPPSFARRTWDRMADDPATASDEAHGFMPHYDQHVWFVGAPEHALLPFNPAVTCAHHAHQGH